MRSRKRELANRGGHVHASVNTFGSYAFGVLGTSKKPEWAVSVLYNDVLPFYEEKQIQIRAILTDNAVTLA